MISRNFQECQHDQKVLDALSSTQKPSCFSDRDWIEWLGLSACCSSSVNRTDVCRDCTPEYKQKMMAQKKCDHVTVEFKTVYKPSSDIWAIDTAEIYGKRQRVARV